MKRILHIIGSMDRAGAETMLMNIYRAIDRTKFQFDFIYFTNKISDYDDEIEELGGKIYRIIESNPLKRMKRIEKLLKDNKQWQTVHSHMLFSNAFHIYAAYRAGVRQRISHSHSTSDLSKSKLVAFLYQTISRRVQHKYTTDFIACGYEAAEFLFPKVKNVLVLPNAIDTEEFANIADNNKDYIKNKFNLSEDTLVLLQLGRLQPVKNHKFTLDIIEQLKNKTYGFKLFIVGQGELEQQLKEEVNKRSLRDYIEFLGVRTDIPYILAGSDIMLMPSLYEGFPVVLVESQASGVPALIADTISAEVDLGLKLVHFESLSTDPNTWADKTLKIIEKQKPSGKERIRVLSEQGFDISSNAEKLEKLYNN